MKRPPDLLTVSLAVFFGHNMNKKWVVSRVFRKLVGSVKSFSQIGLQPLV